MKAWTLLILIVIGIITFNIVLIPYLSQDTASNSKLKLLDSTTSKSIQELESTKDEIKVIEEDEKESDEEEIEDEEEDEEELTDDEIDETQETIIEPTPTKIKIGNWNLQIFGNTKASNDDLMNTYSSIIDNYDIIFIQEIRNIDQTAFPKLCDLLPDYDCRASSRAGRSSSKEQYGVIYKKDIEIQSWNDFNPDSQDRWERPPLEVTFDIDGYELIVYNIHIKPSDVENEINYLEEVVEDNRNVIVLGDLNLDCSYDDGMNGDFEDWNYLIEDDEDTTVSSSDCAYDRIILNDDVYEKYEDDGIYTSGISEDVSDHYLVWVEIEV